MLRAFLSSPFAYTVRPLQVTSVLHLGGRHWHRGFLVVALLLVVCRSDAGAQVTVTLVSAGPPATVVLGLGIGIPRVDGGGCLLAHAVITSAGPAARVSSMVDPGDYCARVFDVGALTELVTVTIALTHPCVRGLGGMIP